jgi:hypothetical protein
VLADGIGIAFRSAISAFAEDTMEPTDMPTSIPAASRAVLSGHADAFPTAENPDFLVLASFAVIALSALCALAVLLPISGDLSAVPFVG